MQTRTMAAMCAAVLAGIFLAAGQTAVAAITIETVPVGNPGNAGQFSGDGAGGYGTTRTCGAVAYTYNIGKYEVTADQYTAFLNAVAKTDAYGLYNTNMWDSPYGCKIQRSGSSGSYEYSVAGDYGNRPVDFVSWGDSVRFANWLTNGQGNGDTETGAYNLNGAMTYDELMAVAVPSAPQRATWSTGAKSYFLLTSEDEWYKAAFHKNDGVTGNYWACATGGNVLPGRDMTEATNPGNNANYDTGSGGIPIDGTHYTTVVGEFQLSDSPYGTFDQAGNAWEWNESILYGTYRCLRGGGFRGVAVNMLAYERSNGADPAYEDYSVGFRVSEVPEPCSAALLLIGTLGVVRRRRKA